MTFVPGGHRPSRTRPESDQLVRIFKGSGRGVRSLAFSPDGTSLAASGYDRKIRLWNLSTGKGEPLVSLGATAMSLAWSPDGRSIFWSCGPTESDWACRTTVTGRTTEFVAGEKAVGAVRISPDGGTLYVATRNGIRRWDLSTESELPAWPCVSPGHLAVSADGRTLASAHPHWPLAEIDAFHVALWDTASGEQTTRLTECTEFFDGLCFTPDGTRLAAVSHQSLWLWELPSGRAICRRPSKKFYTGLAVSPNGRLLATSCNDGTVRFWSAGDGEPLEVFDWEIDKVLCVAFAPDGTRAAAGGAIGRLVVWDVDATAS